MEEVSTKVCKCIYIATLPGPHDSQDEGTTIFRSRSVIITLITMIIYLDVRVVRIYI
jgi:hypothetical protein